MSQSIIHAAEKDIQAIEQKAVSLITQLCTDEDDQEMQDRGSSRPHLFTGTISRSSENADERMQNIKRSLTKTKNEDTSEVQYHHWLVHSVQFNFTIIMATVLNTLQMGLEADYPEWRIAWQICEHVFTAIFLFEMILKMCVLRCRYFHDKANQLDGALAVFSVVDVWLLALIDGIDLQSLSILRIMRLFRLARILRLVRRVKPLVLVIQGVVHALCTSIYVFAVCLFIFYVFAIFLTEHLGKNDANPELYPGYSTEMETIDEQEMMANYNPHVCFGSMMSSMLTLFNMATFTEWAEIVRPVTIKQPLFVPVFFVFATSVGFGVMNVLIGVIVDVVTAESRRIETDFKDQDKKKKLLILEQIQGKLSEIDKNGDGKLDLEELEEALKSDPLKGLVSKINLPVGWSHDEFLDMLDSSGDGVLTHSEFTTNFIRLLDSDDFHQICIMQASINQLKHLLRDQSRYFGHILSNVEHDTTLIKEALGLVIHNQSLHPEHIDNEHAIRTAAELRGHSAREYFKTRSSIKQQMKESSGSTSDEIGMQKTAPHLISQMQMAVKECVQHELSGIKDCLASEVIRSSATLEPKISSNSDLVSQAVMPAHLCPDKTSSIPIDLQVGCSFPWEDLTDDNKSVSSTITFQSAMPEREANKAAGQLDDRVQTLENRDPSGTPLLRQDFECSDEQVLYTHTVLCENADHEKCTHPDNNEQSAATFAEAQSGEHAAAVVDGQTNEALRLSAIHSEYSTHEFLFEEGTQQLGFSFQCVEDWLPVTVQVLKESAASLQGVFEGDRLAECNGISLDGKSRHDVLQLLSARPLALKMLRR